MKTSLLKLAAHIDDFIRLIGHAVSWLVVSTVVITFMVVVMRYAFDFGRIWIQETYLWMHAIIFMAGAAWTLQEEGHVRVDIFYRNFSPRQKGWINLLGVVVLLVPSCSFILWVSMPYVINSWQLLEGSRETGGIPAVFLLKTIIPIMAVLLLLQGVSVAIKGWAAITVQESEAHE